MCIRDRLHTSYTLLRFGGRQPLCGIGVTSLIKFTSNPAACRARIAASRPPPGPFTKHSTSFKPCSIATLAQVSAAICAAKGVLLREPLNPREPALDQESAFPLVSVMVTMVLLNVDLMWAIPLSIFLRSRRFVRTTLRAISVIPPFYFLRFAPTVLAGPLRVRALVLVRCPRTGSPRRCRNPR